MTVKDLKQKLENIDDNLDVFLLIENPEYEAALLNTVEVKNLRFYDESDDDLEAFEDVLVLTDD